VKPTPTKKQSEMQQIQKLFEFIAFSSHAKQQQQQEL